MKNAHLAMLTAAALFLTAASGSIAAPQSPVRSGESEVVIVNTGTRTVPGYQVTVEPHGKISGILTPRRGQVLIRRADQMIPAVRQRFFADLAKAEPLDALPLGQNTQAAGAARGRRRQGNVVRSGRATGAQILIRYRGRQSPNLRDVSSTAGRVLLQDVKQIIQLLRLPVPE